jgi:DNA-binding MarR family transcriptional regulator
MTAETERAALGLRRSEWALLQALGRRQRWSATDNEVAEMTGYSLPTVRKARRALRAKGLINYTSGTGHTSTLYTVLGRKSTGKSDQNRRVEPLAGQRADQRS